MALPGDGSLFTNQVTPVAMYIGEEQVVSAYLGDVLIWDGSSSAFVSILTAQATAVGHAPFVSSTPQPIAVPPAIATAVGLPPVLSVSVALDIPIATAIAAALPPVLRVDATINVPIATAGAVGVPPLTDADIVVPVAEATAQGFAPLVTTSGGANVIIPAAEATAQAFAPTVRVDATIAVPVATASAAATPPTVSVSATITPPVATATAAATAPVVATFANMRMNKSGSFSCGFGAELVTGWVADGSYPNTNIVSNQLKITVAGTGKTITAACAFTTNVQFNTHYMGIYKNGVLIGTEQSLVPIPSTSGTLNFSLGSQSVAVNDTLDMRVRLTGGGTMTVQAAGTFLKIE